MASSTGKRFLDHQTKAKKPLTVSKIPALLLNIQNVEFIRIKAFLEVRNQIDDSQDILKLWDMIFLAIETFEKNSDGVSKLSLEVLS